MYIHRKYYELSYLEKRSCPLELDKCYLDEVRFFAVSICQILSRYSSDNGTAWHVARDTWHVTRGTYGTAGFGQGKERKTRRFETQVYTVG